MNDIEKTVFGNMRKNNILNDDEYSIYLSNVHLSFDFLENELSVNNKKLKYAKFILLPRISNDIESIKFLEEKNLLFKIDYSFIYNYLIVNYSSEEVDKNVIEYIYQKHDKILISSSTIKIIINLLKTQKKNCFELLDLYYEINKEYFVNVCMYLISVHREMFDYLSTKDFEVLKMNKNNLLKLLFLVHKFDTLEFFIEKNKNDIDFLDLRESMITNNDKKMSDFFINMFPKYKSQNVTLLKTLLDMKQLEKINLVFENSFLVENDKIIFDYLSKINKSLDVLEVLENINIDYTKYKYKLFYDYLIDEKYECVKTLLDNQSLIGTFDLVKNDPKYAKILKISTNKNIIDVLKQYDMWI